MTLLSAWGLLLSRLSGQEDVVIGTPAANRMRPEIEGLIGFFVNMLALRLDVSGSPSVQTLLERVKAQTLGAQEHQDLPFEQVVEIVNPARSLAHTPLFQAMFAWQNNEQREFGLSGLHVEPVEARILPPSSISRSIWPNPMTKSLATSNMPALSSIITPSNGIWAICENC